MPYLRLFRADLRSGLAGLPAPENEYSVAMPELPDEEQEMIVEEDAADIKARKAQEAEAARQAEERKKSKVRLLPFSSQRCSRSTVSLICIHLCLQTCTASN